jgi:hypothetical protein
VGCIRRVACPREYVGKHQRLTDVERNERALHGRKSDYIRGRRMFASTGAQRQAYVVGRRVAVVLAQRERHAPMWLTKRKEIKILVWSLLWFFEMLLYTQYYRRNVANRPCDVALLQPR